MATTTNFGWETPDDTDLVKDGALAMRTLGNAIDASLVDLKGGTTGQVLSKNSNTDMDFTWVAQDDSNAIQNAIVDAKGDLIAASAADTPARLAVGNNGDTLVADSSASTGLRWQGSYEAGKNKIINGDFGIWQRGTSLTDPAGSTYLADRWRTSYQGIAPTSRTYSQQSFTPGAAPVAGYEGKFFGRLAITTKGSNVRAGLANIIESARTLAGQTVTFSFWAKSDSARTGSIVITQSFGDGGSPSTAVTVLDTSISLTSSWQRFTTTFSMPSVSGKTFGTNNNDYLAVEVNHNSADGSYLDIWGGQLEAGNTATAFQTATGTLAGELAACQRYYYRYTPSTTYDWLSTGFGIATSTTRAFIPLRPPVTMRTTPTSIDYSTTYSLYQVSDIVSNFTATAISFDTNSVTPDIVPLYIDVASGLTQYRPYMFISSSGAASGGGYIGVSAEL